MSVSKKTLQDTVTRETLEFISKVGGTTKLHSERGSTVSFLRKASDSLASGSRGMSLQRERQQHRIINSYAYSQVEAARTVPTATCETPAVVHQHSQDELDNIPETTIDWAKRFRIWQLQEQENKQLVSSAQLSTNNQGRTFASAPF